MLVGMISILGLPRVVVVILLLTLKNWVFLMFLLDAAAEFLFAKKSFGKRSSAEIVSVRRVEGLQIYRRAKKRALD